MPGGMRLHFVIWTAGFSVTTGPAVTAIVTGLCQNPGKSGSGDGRKANNRAKTRKAQKSQKPLGLAPLWVRVPLPVFLHSSAWPPAPRRTRRGAARLCGVGGVRGSLRRGAPWVFGRADVGGSPRRVPLAGCDGGPGASSGLPAFGGGIDRTIRSGLPVFPSDPT